jgi:hypothetical protein
MQFVFVLDSEFWIGIAGVGFHLMYKCDVTKYTCAEDPKGSFKTMQDCMGGCIAPTYKCINSQCVAQEGGTSKTTCEQLCY